MPEILLPPPLTLVRGTINAIISTIEFTIILWGLSGLLALFGIEIPKGVVFFIYLFILAATAISVWIGLPLVKLNFNKEKLQGNYRYSSYPFKRSRRKHRFLPRRKKGTQLTKTEIPTNYPKPLAYCFKNVGLRWL